MFPGPLTESVNEYLYETYCQESLMQDKHFMTVIYSMAGNKYLGLNAYRIEYVTNLNGNAY